MINNLLTQDIQVNTCKSYIVKKKSVFEKPIEAI